MPAAKKNSCPPNRYSVLLAGSLCSENAPAARTAQTGCRAVSGACFASTAKIGARRSIRYR